MFEFLHQYWLFKDKPDDIGCLLSEISLWQLEDGTKEPMDGAWLDLFWESVGKVIDEERNGSGYDNANIKLTK